MWAHARHRCHGVGRGPEPAWAQLGFMRSPGWSEQAGSPPCPLQVHWLPAAQSPEPPIYGEAEAQSGKACVHQGPVAPHPGQGSRPLSPGGPQPGPLLTSKPGNNSPGLPCCLGERWGAQTVVCSWEDCAQRRPAPGPRSAGSALGTPECMLCPPRPVLSPESRP